MEILIMEREREREREEREKEREREIQKLQGQKVEGEIGAVEGKS